MKVARLVQWILLGLASVGFVGLTVLFARLAFNAPQVTPLTDFGWREIIAAVPGAHSPAQHQEIHFLVDSPFSEEAKEFFGRSNGFVASCGVLITLGFVGYSLIVAAIASRKSGRFSTLAILGGSGAILVCYWLFGFNSAYPIDFAMGRTLPSSIGGPLTSNFIDPNIFGNAIPYTVWTDFFYQAVFAICAGMFVTGLLAGRYRTPTVVLAAIVTGAIGYPLATLWLWGGGWLGVRGAVDFGGAGSVHLLAGGVGLAIAGLARICPPLAPWQMDTVAAGTPINRNTTPVRLGGFSLAAFCIGALGFLLLPVGMQAGSVLSIDVPVVASVLQNTGLSVGGSVLTAAAVTIPLARRPRPVILVIAAIAGLAASAASADSLYGGQALVLGVMAGAASSLLTWCFDRYQFDDPMGLVSANLVGGLIGLIAAGILKPEVSVAVQSIAALSFAALGITIGACIGLLGWMLGLLWKPASPPEPQPGRAVAREGAH